MAIIGPTGRLQQQIVIEGASQIKGTEQNTIGIKPGADLRIDRQNLPTAAIQSVKVQRVHTDETLNSNRTEVPQRSESSMYFYYGTNMAQTIDDYKSLVGFFATDVFKVSIQLKENGVLNPLDANLIQYNYDNPQLSQGYYDNTEKSFFIYSEANKTVSTPRFNNMTNKLYVKLVGDSTVTIPHIIPYNIEVKGYHNSAFVTYKGELQTNNQEIYFDLDPISPYGVNIIDNHTNQYSYYFDNDFYFGHNNNNYGGLSGVGPTYRVTIHRKK